MEDVLKRAIHATCWVFVIMGMVYFLAPAVFKFTHQIFPDSFEWPVGYVSNVISTQSGQHIVPDNASGRIQLYTPDWQFIRGWNVDGAYHDFKLTSFNEDTKQIEVITEPGNLKYSYDINGKLLSKESYAPATYDSFPDMGTWHSFPPQFWWLAPVNNPMIAWGMMVIGGIGLTLCRKKKLKQP